MKYTFIAYGHPNILATHKTTLEITKDSELTKNGDCIVAVWADFSLQQLQRIIGSCSNSGKIKLTIAVTGLKAEVVAVANKEFSSENEIVLRKGIFISERTLGIHADKAAAEVSRKLVEKLKNAKTAVSVTVEKV